MSTLEVAKAAISTEITHLQMRLTSLRNSLQHLNNALGNRFSTLNSPGTQTDNGQGLPKMGESFWLNLIPLEPTPSSAIFSAALESLPRKPNPDQTRLLQYRMSFTLATMTKKGTIQSEGAGRDRRYLRSTA